MLAEARLSLGRSLICLTDGQGRAAAPLTETPQRGLGGTANLPTPHTPGRVSQGRVHSEGRPRLPVEVIYRQAEARLYVTSFACSN